MPLSPAPTGVLAPSSVFADVYRRLADVFPTLRVDVRDGGEAPRTGDGWLTAEELVRGGPAFEAFLGRDEEQIARDWGRAARPDVIASMALHRYAWPACLLFTLPWFLARRVPSIPVGALSFQRGLGRMSVALGEFACLPDDPAAASPGARVVPDEDALRAEVRAAVAEHLAPVLGTFGPRMRRRGRALWGMATDEIVEGLWYVGHLLGEEERAVAELRRLLPEPVAPYAGSAAFRELTVRDGQSVPTRDRVTCCLFYTLRPDSTCATCPRTCDSERARKLSDAN
ncbi:(2Fe-2S)-binding protein [Streptomyces montanisoli]|uniref:(2Fe-2S)-binding protein n=1 Tax=Streptomyces montanisoli TaxID=2798581 RepID=A0A940RZQ7_9ACTN|nr:(2Fe-2S)-binding protein [Streptomyces montanisoli]MBP0460044.1 (2Fe-2S)-binding protein [Streptomyces montanisoli]